MNKKKKPEQNKENNNNFWQLINNQLLSKEQVTQLLVERLGQQTDRIAENCLNSLSKKVLSYYGQEENKNESTSISNCTGTVQEIVEKIFKGESRRVGEKFFVLKLDQGQKLQAYQKDLPADKWTQLEKLAILGQNLVFKYKKWFTNKELLDFRPNENITDKFLMNQNNFPPNPINAPESKH